MATAVLFEGRFTRPFDPDRPLKFLANPCEMAPVMEVVEAAPALASRPGTGSGAPRGEGRAALLRRPATSPLATPREVLRQLVAERAELPLECGAGRQPPALATST